MACRGAPVPPAAVVTVTDSVKVLAAAFSKLKGMSAPLPLLGPRDPSAPLAWQAGPHSVKPSVYRTRFSRFISSRVASTFLTSCFLITWIWRSFCRISRDTLSGRSALSTTPLTKRR